MDESELFFLSKLDSVVDFFLHIKTVRCSSQKSLNLKPISHHEMNVQFFVEQPRYSIRDDIDTTTQKKGTKKTQNSEWSWMFLIAVISRVAGRCRWLNA